MNNDAPQTAPDTAMINSNRADLIADHPGAVQAMNRIAELARELAQAHPNLNIVLGITAPDLSRPELQDEVIALSSGPDSTVLALLAHTTYNAARVFGDDGKGQHPSEYLPELTRQIDHLSRKDRVPLPVSGPEDVIRGLDGVRELEALADRLSLVPGLHFAAQAVVPDPEGEARGLNISSANGRESLNLLLNHVVAVAQAAQTAPMMLALELVSMLGGKDE